MFTEKPIISQWIADMYDRDITETKDVEMLLSLVGAKPKRILEACCGSGRILVPLAQAGHTVVGFDADACMLAKIANKSNGLTNIQWHEADAITSDWGEGYDVVVLAGNILYNIISELPYAQAQETLIRKAAAALVSGGHVFIEYQPGGSCITQRGESNSDSFENVVWQGFDNNGALGKMTLIGNRYDASTGLSHFIRRFELTLPNGETIEQDIPCQKHFAPLALLHQWLQAAGCVIEQEYSDFTGAPVTDTSRGVVIYARKA